MIRWILLAACVIVLTGCEAQVVKVPPRTGVSPTPAAPKVAEVSAKQDTGPAFNPEDINVQVGDEQALAALIERHKGKIVFVDYWATWCEPCVEAFPHTVDAFEKYEKLGMTAIAVSFDATDKEPEVRRFLARHRVRFENLICSYDAGPEAFEKFGIDLVPHFRLYDRQGKLRFKWDAEPPDLDARIAELLAEK